MYHGRGDRGAIKNPDYPPSAAYYHNPRPIPIRLSHSAHYRPPLIRLGTAFACRGDIASSMNASLASRFISVTPGHLVDVRVDWHDSACLATWRAMRQSEIATGTDMFASAVQASGELARSFPNYIELRPGLVPVQQITHDLDRIRLHQRLWLDPGPDSWLELFMGQVMFDSISIWQFGPVLFVHESEGRLLDELNVDRFWDVRQLSETMP